MDFEGQYNGVNGVPISSSPAVIGGGGDIILVSSKEKKSKKGLVLGIIIGLLILIAGICIGIYFLLFSDRTDVALSLMHKEVANVQTIEQLFTDSYYNELSVAAVFTEKKHEDINNAMSGFSNLQKELSGIGVFSIREDMRENYQIVQERLNSRVEGFQKSVDFYNSLYSAYINNDASGLTNFAESDDYYTALIAERFSNYINEQTQWREVIGKNNCSMVTGVELTEVCAEAVSEYAENINSLQNSTVVVSAIFDMNDIEEIANIFEVEDIVNIDDVLIVPYINKIIGEEK